jgi:hypothetical protein
MSVKAFELVPAIERLTLLSEKSTSQVWQRPLASEIRWIPFLQNFEVTFVGCAAF